MVWIRHLKKLVTYNSILLKMIDYKFGLKVQPCAGDGAPFSVSKPAGVAGDNKYNPYGGNYFNSPNGMVATGGDKITSIPSPYARMHLTDIAFREYVSGVGVMNTADLTNKALPSDYVKAISHCLDMFEMLFRLTDLDLLDHGITIKINNLITSNTPGVNGAKDGNPYLDRYIKTLELFRNSYNSVIKSRIQSGKSYKYDFTSNYLFKYKGVTFGSTSPFTGFFAKIDCNLVTDSGEAVLSYNGHNFLTNKKVDWQLFEERDINFLKFLYLLLKDTGLSSIYENLFKALSSAITNKGVDTNDLANQSFAQIFPDFNLGPQANQLPQVLTTTGQTFVRPNNVDRCYLKYLLYLDNPFDFSVDFEQFEKKISERVSPDGTCPMPWLTVNDLLSDALFVLPYEVDDKYEAISYIDEENKQSFRRCLIPIKQEALNYVELDKLIAGLKIRKYSNKHYCVLLTLTLTTGGKIELRRDYYDKSCEKGTCCYPNGVLVQGVDMKQFVFGVYPFVKSAKFENIYKVLFYNDFEQNCNVEFYYEDNGRVAKYPGDQVKSNVTNTIESGGAFYPHNCTYFEVSGGDLGVEGNRASIRFAEITADVCVPNVDGTNQIIKGTGLIVPNLCSVAPVDNYETTVAIDLGTSNTYMAYYHNAAHAAEEVRIQDFKTIHGAGETEFLELEFMHKDVNQRIIPAGELKNFYQDAILPTANDSFDPESLSAQLSEFIPARIVSGDGEEGFRFPIPSVINRLRSQNGHDGMTPLLNRSIPFAYYSIGWRKDGDRLIDNIAEGTFKWFYYKNAHGIYQTDDQRKSDFVAFMSELLFIVRSNMLCNGYDLDKCKIIWTYPLSFQNELVRNYTKEWNVNFCKFFHPDWLIAAGNSILPTKEAVVKEYIKSTNESLTPFFACCDNPGAVHHLNLVIDMGGGSTDVIGYKDNNPIFITSFGFAGNSLYLDGNLNHDNVNRRNNYIAHYVQVASETIANQPNVLNETQKIDINAPLSSLMNYGFSQNPGDFQAIFANTVPAFMLRLHNYALFYHIAQVCYAMSPDEMPVNIYLTGNGSKLITMPENNDVAVRNLRKAFQYVYGKDDEQGRRIEVTPYPNPKAATVYGALQGNLDETLAFNVDARNSRVVAFGDETTFERIPVEDDGIPSEQLAGREGEVYENVCKFIDSFYQTYGNHRPPMSKQDMLECLEFVRGDAKNQVNGEFLSDSLFFQYVSLLMEQVSFKLLKK